MKQKIKLKGEVTLPRLHNQWVAELRFHLRSVCLSDSTAQRLIHSGMGKRASFTVVNDFLRSFSSLLDSHQLDGVVLTTPNGYYNLKPGFFLLLPKS